MKIAKGVPKTGVEPLLPKEFPMTDAEAYAFAQSLNVVRQHQKQMDQIHKQHLLIFHSICEAHQVPAAHAQKFAVDLEAKKVLRKGEQDSGVESG